jgi:acyl-CoA thioester hydrolase
MSDATAGPVHRLEVRVYYEDTDAAGIVYYANYLKFAERGRTEMMRNFGFAHSQVAADTGIRFAVRRVSADYQVPARLDDRIVIETRLLELGAATLRLDQRVCRDGIILAALDLLIACIGEDGRPRRLPVGLRAALSKQLQASVAPSIVQKTP